MEAETLELAGKLYENATALMERLGIGHVTLNEYVKSKRIPMPIRIARRRYFDRVAVDTALIDFTNSTP